MSHVEPEAGVTAQKLNWLRAGVLGANDGIVSVASLVVGVAGATSDTGAIATAGTAALVGGAVSMALGEYVSVSSQRDSERHMIRVERQELREDPQGEFDELVDMLQERGITRTTARLAAHEMTEHDALAAHLEVELGIDQHDLINPWHAAFSSAVAFTLGALLPLVAMLVSGETWRIPVTTGAVLIALALTGSVAAHIGGGPKGAAALRLVVGGALALGLTYAIGLALGTSGLV